MVSGISSDVSALQVLRATQAFKGAIQSSLKINTASNGQRVDDIDVKVSLSQQNPVNKNNSNTDLSKLENPLLTQKKEYANEIKQFANKYGNNLDDNEIDYAMRYGVSVLVDHVV